MVEEVERVVHGIVMGSFVHMHFTQHAVRDIWRIILSIVKLHGGGSWTSRTWNCNGIFRTYALHSTCRSWHMTDNMMEEVEQVVHGIVVGWFGVSMKIQDIDGQ